MRLRSKTKAGAAARVAPGYMNFDFRAGYRFRLGGNQTLDASFDAINVTNRANFNAPGGDRRNANFLP
jgi:outer membrane receptor protein involved in Fe transport